MTKKYLFITFLLVFLGCNQTKNEPKPFNVPGIKTTITDIQISPLAYDGAIVAVIGNVIKILDNKFIIADAKGNTIWVLSKDNSNIDVKEHLLVNGIYRKQDNIIETDQIIKIIVDDDGIRPLND